MSVIRIGMVGLDTSHVSAFANILHDECNAHHVPGARIVAAYPGGSPDFEASISRVGLFTADLRDKHQVQIVDDIASLRGACDAVFLETIDGRVHLELFRQVAGWGVPVFIDKPLSVSWEDAKEIAALAVTQDIRVMSASAMRYAESFRNALNQEEGCPITGGDFFGPLQLQEKCPGYFWYGIHSVEMLYATFGTGCAEVRAMREGDYDLIVAKWEDGRIGTVRGNRTGNNGFGGVIHREKRSCAFDVSTAVKPYYASLLQEILGFLRDESPGVPLDESTEVIRFLEAANESLDIGEPVRLKPSSQKKCSDQWAGALPHD